MIDTVNWRYLQGVKHERERILALLEEHRVIGYAEEITHEVLIALIKGENK